MPVGNNHVVLVFIIVGSAVTETLEDVDEELVDTFFWQKDAFDLTPMAATAYGS